MVHQNKQYRTTTHTNANTHNAKHIMDNTSWTTVDANDAGDATTAPQPGDDVKAFLDGIGVVGEHAEAMIAEGFDTVDGITNDVDLEDLTLATLRRSRA